jgi:hypothetical protein
MEKYFYFGEKVTGFETPVLNEREARAGAGILLLPAIASFVNSYLTHDFAFTKIFVTVFMVDFFVRVFINPTYAPSLILGRFFVQNQSPEYVGAQQKRFAWSIGFILSVIMFFIIVVFEIMTTVKIAICLLCITLLFSETAFGICLGCILYFRLKKTKPIYCPGNVCQVKNKEKIQTISRLQIVTLVIFLIGIVVLSLKIIEHDTHKQKAIKTNTMKCSAGKCS